LNSLGVFLVTHGLSPIPLNPMLSCVAMFQKS